LEQNYFIWHGKKKGKSKTSHKKNGKNGEFERPKSKSLVSKGVLESCLDPNTLSFFFTIVLPKFLSLNYSLPFQSFL
jgi:threonine/homoserine/homoserine lactone efflux protein